MPGELSAKDGKQVVSGRHWALGTRVGTRVRSGGSSWGNVGRAEGSEARDLQKKKFGGTVFSFTKDRKSPQPPGQLVSWPWLAEPLGCRQKTSPHAGLGLP